MATVLIVEDDEDIRISTAELLLEEGYSVRLAEEGAEALRLLRAGLRPCLILLDLMMPVMDGLQFLAILRSDPKFAKLAVVVVTASIHAPPNEEICRKPGDLDTLFRMVARHCRRS